MGISEKVWDVLTIVIKMDDKVERMTDTIKGQQMRIEDLTVRVVRLETELEIALASQKPKTTSKKLT
jgi:FtsZ-binding cell division protein ZapB